MQAIPMKRLQAADQVLGVVLCALLQPVRWLRALRRNPAPIARNVLLIKFWGIGSLQLLTPAVNALRRRHPDARLTLLTLAANAEFVRGLGVFDEVLTLDVQSGRGPAGWFRIHTRILRLLAGLRRRRFDRVYDFEFFTRFSALVSLATGARETSGFASPHVNRGGFHRRTVPFNRYWHVARNFRALAGGENGHEVEPDDLVPFTPTDAQRASVRAKLVRAGLPAGRPFVVLNPNAGELSLERRWPATSFAELARVLANDDGVPVVLVGSPSEAEYVHSIAARVGDVTRGHVLDLSGQLSVGELCAALADAHTVVTNDSGPMHIAAALATPTIGLFGPETPVMYGPLGERASALWRPPVCSPCINVHENKVANCVRGFPECLVNLSVEVVLEETRAWMLDAELVPAARRAARGGLHVLRGGMPADREHSIP
ncbi:MAG: glycosyltransferase family 9 protein [Planctomycetota bacterium]|nr:glycosyltransferase family 9 protein [Planctomycetota bacterium]